MPVISNTVEGVTQIIRTCVEQATGWTTIIGPVQGPEPANQYCIVTDKYQYKQPHDVLKYTQTEKTITEHQRSESSLTFEIQARGFGAMEAIDKVTSYFDSGLRDSDLWPYVGSGGHDDAQSVNTYHQGKILEVAIVSVTVHANLTKTNIIEWFNRVDITTIKDNNEIGTTTVPDAVQDNQGE